jgi:hypothetical protein
VATAQLAVDMGRVDGPMRSGRRRFKHAVSIAIGMVALGAVVALSVEALDGQILAPNGVPVTSVRGLPGDLFTAPRAPNPRIVVRYTAPRSMPAAPVPAAPAKMAPTAAPTPGPQNHPSPSPSPWSSPSPSPSPSPSWGGDD